MSKANSNHTTYLPLKYITSHQFDRYQQNQQSPLVSSRSCFGRVTNMWQD